MPKQVAGVTHLCAAGLLLTTHCSAQKQGRCWGLVAFIAQGSGLEGGESQEVGQEDVSNAGEQNLNSQREGKRSEALLREPLIRAGSRSQG